MFDSAPFFIMGGARSGLGAARLLKEQGRQVFVSEYKQLSSETKASLDQWQIPFEENGHCLRSLVPGSWVVVSPGIPLDHPFLMQARQIQCRLVSEIEVASWFLPTETLTVGITGTNGKSTTTHFLTHLFNQNRRRAVACGNFGLPFCEAVRDAIEDPHRILVVEVSSYQLELTMTWQPDVTLFLNLQDDHLARYENLDTYLKAKWRLVALTKPTGGTWIDEQVFTRALQLGLSLPPGAVVRVVSHTRPTSNEVVFKNEKWVDTVRRLPLPLYGGLKEQSWLLWAENLGVQSISSVQWHVQNPRLLGFHNAWNCTFAAEAASFLGIEKAAILSEWETETSTYLPLAHRLEAVTHHHTKQVLVINDSKATNVSSTLVALQTFVDSGRRVHLLLGGRAKGDSYLPLCQVPGILWGGIYPFGEAGPLIAQELSSAMCFVQKTVLTLEEAAQAAWDRSQSGDVLLLSPACSSLDAFDHFEHRGDFFKAWVFGYKNS